MAEVQLRTLRVSAELDPSAYKAGMDTKIAADKAGAASSAAVASAVTTTDQKLTDSRNVLERLSRSYVDGYATAQRFQSALGQLEKGVESGKIAMTQASSILDGIYRKYNMTADAASLASRGQVELAAAVERANAKLAAQAAIKPPAFDVAALRSAQAGSNFANDLNSRLGIGGQSSSARASAAVFEEAAREADRYAQQAMTLRAALDPVGASQSRLNAEIAEYTALLNRAEISTTEFAQAQTMARARHDQFVSSLNKTPANDNLSRRQGFDAANIGYQFQDIGVTAAMGMSPMMIALQQGTQLSAVLGPMGATGAVKGLGAAFLSLISPVSLVTIGFVAAAAAAIQYFTTSKEGSDASAQFIAKQNDAIRAAAQAWGAAAPALQAYVAQLDRAKNFEVGREAYEALATKEFDGLSEKLEGINQQFTMAGRSLRQVQADPAFIRDFGQAFSDLRSKLDSGTASMFDINRAQMALAEAMANYGTKEVRAFSSEFDKITDAINRSAQAAATARAEFIKSIAGGATVQDIVENNQVRMGDRVVPAGSFIPRNPGVPSERPNIELEGLDNAKTKDLSTYEQLKQASDQRIASLQNEIALVGQAASVQARLRAEFEAEAQYREQVARAGGVVDEREIALLKEKAAAVAQLTQQLAAANLIQNQNDEIEKLRLESQLIGASASQRATMTAALQAEQQLRQQGIDLLSREGQTYIANAQAIAQARLEIERQNAAYSSLQQAGGSAIDSLTVGTGSLRDRLKSAADTMFQWIQQMTIANPAKNAIFGTNLPTMGDLFSGRPSIPGATTTGSMMVTAGTVMVNGGVTSGLLPGANTTLGGFLGYSPAANQNAPIAANQNPALAGLLNDPSLASRVNPTTAAPAGSIEAYIRNAAIQRGIDPNVAVRVAQSEGGLNSWNRQSEYINSAGMREQSYGPYQLYMNGGLGNRFQQQTGLDPRVAANGPAGVDFALDTASKEGWGAWYGARKAGISDWQGIGKNPGIDSTTTNSITQSNNALKQFSATTASASKDVGVLGDTSSKLGTQLTDGLGKITTSVPAVTPTATPATPTGGGNIFSSLFGGFFKLLGFADGTNFAPGGPVMVGERGREIVNLPRGSQVVPNHKLNHGSSGGGGVGRMKVDVGVSVDNNGNLQAFVKNVAQQTAEETTGSGIALYHSRFGDYVEEYRENPYNRGAA